MLSSRKRLVLVLFGKKTVTTSTFRIENRVFGNKTSSRGRKSSFRKQNFFSSSERERELQRASKSLSNRLKSSRKGVKRSEKSLKASFQVIPVGTKETLIRPSKGFSHEGARCSAVGGRRSPLKCPYGICTDVRGSVSVPLLRGS